jgi:Ca2+-binding EF-hand superfamily protein
MKNTTKILGMTAAVALLSAPAMAGYNNMSASTFNKIDTNNNGRITMNEFENNTIHDNEAAVFKMYDQDNNGYITKAELEQNSKIFAQPGNAGTTSNLKSKSGQPVGSMDAKYYGEKTAYIDNPFYNDPEIRAKNDTNYNIDNPFVDDPEIPNDRDTNWNWPRDWTWNDNIDTNQPLFAQLDTNNNGMISQREFMAGTQHRNEAAVFAMLDKNESGSISPYEIRTYEKTGGRR